jgi:hypothetical protein
VPAHRRHAARDVESAAAQLPALRTVCFEKLAALVRRLDLAKLARRAVGIENVEPLVVVKNSAVQPPDRVVGNVRPLRRAEGGGVGRSQKARPENPAPAPTSSASSSSLSGTEACADR